MRFAYRSGLCFIVLVLLSGCEVVTIEGKAANKPIRGAEIVAVQVALSGEEQILPALNAPVITNARGGYAYLLDSAVVRENLNAPLTLYTRGGSMGHLSAPAPVLSALVPDPYPLVINENLVTAHLSPASSVAAGLMKQHAKQSVEQAYAILQRVEAMLDVDLSKDPTDPYQAVTMFSICIDQNLDLQNNAENTPAVDEFIDYLVANIRSTSGMLDTVMEDPANPGSDIQASFTPFGTGMLAALLPEGPTSFHYLSCSADSAFVENNGLDYAVITVSMRDACALPMAEIEDARVVVSKGYGTLVEEHSMAQGSRTFLLMSTMAGELAVDVTCTLPNGNTITHPLQFNVLDLHIDSDGDGFMDGLETMGWDIIIDENGYGTDVGTDLLTVRHVSSDPFLADTDFDGLSDYEEYLLHTDPQAADTDGDGLSDYREWHQWRSSPVSVDSDSDARGPGHDQTLNALLFDGNEVAFTGTSPTLADTDGDGRTDYEELDHPARSPIVADLPQLSLHIVDTVDVRLDVEYAEEAGTERQYGTELTQSQTETRGSHSEHAIKTGLEFGYETGDSLFKWGKLSGKVTFEYGYTWGTSKESSNTAQQAYVDYTTDSRTHTETSASGSMSMGVQLVNTGNVAYTLTRLAFTARHWKPEGIAGETDQTGAFATLATLIPALDGSISLAPQEETPVIQVQATDVNASRIKDFLARPDSLHIGPAYYELTNAEGLSFAFLEEVTLYRTASIEIDYGDGRVETYRVATNAVRNANGSYAGVRLGTVMQDILGIPYQTRPHQTIDPDAASNEDILYSIRDTYTESDPDKGFWALVVNSDTAAPVGAVDFNDIVLQATDRVLLLFMRDDDNDGLYTPEEQHYRTDDENEDQDGDGLTDAEEVRYQYEDSDGNILEGGWDVVVGDKHYHVFSDPTTVDQDGDGLWDGDEKAAGTDPTLADTDHDGLPDGSDPYPLNQASTLYVKASDILTYDGGSWETAYPNLLEALLEVATRNTNTEAEDDVSEVWVAQGVYTPNSAAVPDAPFPMLNNVGIYGGFEGVETETKQSQRNSNPITNGMVLSGDVDDNDIGNDPATLNDNLSPILVAESVDDTAVLDGFLITAGNARASDVTWKGYGGGMVIASASPVLRNLFFYDNNAEVEGAGIFMDEGAGTALTDCIFAYNSTAGNGGGISMAQVAESEVPIQLLQCNFSHNTAAAGGGIYYDADTSDSRNLEVEDCQFIQNTSVKNMGAGLLLDEGSFFIANSHLHSHEGGGIRVTGNAEIVLTQCALWKNVNGDHGAGLRLLHNSHAWIQNCSFVSNSCEGHEKTGAGLYLDENTYAEIINTIFWNNEDSVVGDRLHDQLSSNPADINDLLHHVTINSSCVQKLYHGGGLGPELGSWNTDADPQFMDLETGNLRLTVESSCIDAGSEFVDADPLQPGYQPLPETDLAGYPRLIDGDGNGLIRIDMGAYEFQSGG